MNKEIKLDKEEEPRNRVAYFILIASSLAILILASITILKGDEDTSMMIFNTTLPVFASWIGTVLAFYFGRENFESANRQVQNIVTNMTPTQKVKHQVDSVMITPYAMTTFKMSDSIENIKISQLKKRCKTYDVSRLPILNAQNQIRYIIHRSKIDNYLLNNANDIDNLTLKDFLESNNQMNNEDDESRRFIIVSKYTTIEALQKKLQKCKKCKDVFVTATGKQDEVMLGWIPDVHLLEYLEV